MHSLALPTEIGRISVAMYVSDQFVYGKVHLTENGVIVTKRNDVPVIGVACSKQKHAYTPTRRLTEK